MSASACDILIRGATVVDTQGQQVADVAVIDGKIAAIGPDLGTSAQLVIDAQNHFVLPGYIDAHVHLNEPGREHWEGFETGSAALAAGGCTCFVDMPLNSTPVLDAASFAAKVAALEKHSRLDGALWGGLTPLNLDKLAELAACGVVGFKAFMSNSGMDDFPCADLATLRTGMSRAADLRLPVAVHAESEEMTSRLTRESLAQGGGGIHNYLATRPIEAELEAIGQALALARQTGCALHVVHVSSAAGLKMIAEAKKSGVNVTAETCPHYLLLDEDDVYRLGALGKCAPPLRPADEKERLWTALQDGWIDTIGSDHSPSPPNMKGSANFFKVWGGIAGAQHNYPLLFEEAVLNRKIAPSLIARLTAHNVARRFGLANKGDLRVGLDADLVLIDPDSPHKITSADLLTRHKLSAYAHRTTRVRIAATIARGRIVHGPNLPLSPRSARILRPSSHASMTPLPSQTRTRVRARHALITPDGHVASVIPGITGARVVAHITPAMGAGFAQMTIDFEPQGSATISADGIEYFFYVQTGSVEAVISGKINLLTAGSYLYLPPKLGATISTVGATARVIAFQKKFVPVATAETPPPMVGHTSKIVGQPFLGDPKALLQVLLPDEVAFDFAVNIFTYQPGATLPFVETHVMEHGLLMLSGGGTYQLEEERYAVTAGDVIWMAPFCPQWFIAEGNTPASYIYYKDVNRPLIAP